MRGKLITTLAMAAAVLGACATSETGGNGPTVEVRFDPNSYNGQHVLEAAVAQCQAKGRPGQFQGAVPYKHQASTNAGAWQYKIYECTRKATHNVSMNQR